MSNDKSSEFFEFKDFKDHLRICGECQKRDSIILSLVKQLVDETYEEIMAHTLETGGNEMLEEQIKQFEKLMEEKI